MGINQRGFIALSPMGYITIGLGAIILVLGMVIKYQSVRLELADQFKASVESLGEAARKEKKRIEAENKLKKENADESLRKLRIANADLTKRVRDNASSSFVSRETPITGSPDLACFSKSELDGALQRFARGTAELIIEGTEATIGLDSVKRWAQ